MKLILCWVFISCIFFSCHKSYWNINVQKVVKVSGASLDHLQASIAVDNGIAVIGVSWEENGTMDLDTGMVLAGVGYVLEKDGNDQWQEVQILKASDRAIFDMLGHSCAIDHHTIILGAPQKARQKNNGEWQIGTGAAYIFEKTKTDLWKETAVLQAPPENIGNGFGWAVAIDGRTAFVSDIGKNYIGARGDTLKGAGVVYVYQQDSSGQWKYGQMLHPSDLHQFMGFGSALAVNKNRLVIGAYRAKTHDRQQSGAAYIFTLNSKGKWQETQKLMPQDGQEKDSFGQSIQMSNEYIVIGAPDKNGLGKNSSELFKAGAVYVFSKNETQHWQQIEKLQESEPNAFNQFGFSLHHQASQILIGAVADGDPVQKDGSVISAAGSVYLFTLGKNGIWQETKKIVAPDRQGGRFFGSAVGMTNNHIFVGQRMSGSGENSGLFYIFGRK